MLLHAKVKNWACYPSKARDLEFVLPATATVGDLRNYVAEKESYPVDSFDMYLGFRVKLEDDSKPLADYGIEPAKPFVVKIERAPQYSGQSFNHIFTRETAHYDPVRLTETKSNESNVSTPATSHWNPSPADRPIPTSNFNTTWNLTNYSKFANYSGYSPAYLSLTKKSETGFVGLSNQGATCYMNSLIQALFMTPEFRAAVYKWNFDEHCKREWQRKFAAKGQPDKDSTSENKEPVNELKNNVEDSMDIDSQDAEVTQSERFNEWKKKVEQLSIPRQLQKLFVMLQLSDERAVPTKGLTKSFGWTDSEAFIQHDVQELCRVLFDALEKAWQGTDQANLINELYQGEMKDYVKCQSCGWESARTDKYLDIPLVIKAFGSDHAVGSVEEALSKFIEPELLTGDNKYFCERCNAKVDALKGLKFTSFPYILTLQLKRFDYDFVHMRRIKLNNRVSFPEVLNLNRFLDREDSKGSSPTTDAELAAESSTSEASSESATTHLHGEQMDAIDSSATAAGVPADSPEVDAMEANGANTTTKTSNYKDKDALHAENIEKQIEEALKDGPHVYELYAILLHGGSALGGHYYAYIKNFNDKKWYNFNDSLVTHLDPDQIEDAYGNDSSMSLYGSNAYMLMYRKVDKKRNMLHISKDEIPEAIRDISMKEFQEQKRMEKERWKDFDTITLKVLHKGSSRSIKVNRSASVADVLKASAEAFNLLPSHDLRDMRLRRVHPRNNQPTAPFEDLTKKIDQYRSYNDTKVYLEVKEPGAEWPPYNPDDYCFVVWGYCDEKWEKSELYLSKFASGRELQQALEQKFSIPVDKQVICTSKYTLVEILDKSTLESSNISECITDGSTIWVEPAYEEDEATDTPKAPRAFTFKDQDKIKHHVIKFTQLTIPTSGVLLPTITPLFELSFSGDVTYGDVKKQLSNELKQKKNMDVPPERIRVVNCLSHTGGSRILNYKVYHDSAPLEMLPTQTIQILDHPEPKTKPEEAVYWIVRWHPSELKLERCFDMAFNPAETSLDMVAKAIEARVGVDNIAIEFYHMHEFPPYPAALVRNSWTSRSKYGETLLKDLQLTEGDCFVWKPQDEAEKEMEGAELEALNTEEHKKRAAYLYKMVHAREKHLVIKQSDVDL